MSERSPRTDLGILPDVVADLAVRVARAEMERDAAIKRAKNAEECCAAVISQDVEKMLDTLNIIGIPARSLADIYATVAEHRKLVAS